MKGIKIMYDERPISKRDKIISVILNFDFDRCSSPTEWINLYIDDSGYPIFNRKTNSVEVRLIHTSDRDGELSDIDFTLEVFVYGKTIVTCFGKAPVLCLKVSQAIVTDYLEALRDIYKNEKRIKHNRKFNLFPHELVAVG